MKCTANLAGAWCSWPGEWKRPWCQWVIAVLCLAVHDFWVEFYFVIGSSLQSRPSVRSASNLLNTALWTSVASGISSIGVHGAVVGCCPVLSSASVAVQFDGLVCAVEAISTLFGELECSVVVSSIGFSDSVFGCSMVAFVSSNSADANMGVSFASTWWRVGGEERGGGAKSSVS